MAAIVTGCDLGTAICEALGLEAAKVSRITIESAAGDLAKVIIERGIDEDEVGKLRRVIARYSLADKEESAGEVLVDDGIVRDATVGSAYVKKFRAA